MQRRYLWVLAIVAIVAIISAVFDVVGAAVTIALLCIIFLAALGAGVVLIALLMTMPALPWVDSRSTTAGRVIGFAHRLGYATLLSVLAVYACYAPFLDTDARQLTEIFCYVAAYPTALMGKVLSPLLSRLPFPMGGIEFPAADDSSSSWCHWCSMGDVFKWHLLFAIPNWLMLFYIPTFLIWFGKRIRRTGATFRTTRGL